MPPDTADGLWVSITDLAKMRGVTKQTIAEKVRRLESEGRLSCREQGRGRPKLVNVAAFDIAVAETGDAIRAEAAARRRGSEHDPLPPPQDPPSGDPVLSREQARLAAYKADLAQIELDKRRGQLIDVESVQAAMVRASEVLVQRIERLPSRADDLAAAVAGEGVNGARQFLKQMARELREALAQDMRLLSTADAPAPEEETEE